MSECDQLDIHTLLTSSLRLNDDATSAIIKRHTHEHEHDREKESE